MPITMANAGDRVIIKEITGNDEIRQHLAELGFVVDSDVTVVSEINGNLILQVRDSRIALGKSMVLNLFDPPCVVAMATILREMGSRKWGWIAIGYQVAMGYVLAFLSFQLGSWWFFGSGFGIGQAIALLVIVMIIYFVVRKPKTVHQAFVSGVKAAG